MLRKPWKTIQRDNGKIEIYGNNHVRPILQIWELQEMGKEIPDWIEKDRYDEGWTFFVYKGDVFCLQNLAKVENYAPEWEREFNNYENDTYFSGILVKYAIDVWTNEPGVKVYTFIAS